MSSDPIYAELIELARLVMLIEPAILETLCLVDFGVHMRLGSSQHVWEIKELIVSLRRRLGLMAAVETAAIAKSLRLCGGSIRTTRKLNFTCAGWGEDDEWDSDELPELIDSWIDL
ncbi:hypothetical protein B0H17DRAFT_1215518 [Mycena rosella]|uniref:Uncharacterized protein n=1 Tax=Mycena rosella TaxID=1033263 RepID=A0AAD7CH81_MYCRO|nr:hypothetical protein B0H17DRAFT_1215518 [Mycena rosella]